MKSCSTTRAGLNGISLLRRIRRTPVRNTLDIGSRDLVVIQVSQPRLGQNLDAVGQPVHRLEYVEPVDLDLPTSRLQRRLGTECVFDFAHSYILSIVSHPPVHPSPWSNSNK